ncbi:MAG TPA: sulfotransferase [Armatimonadota bacterium]|nr:sulfotransferase [Armatimonadota bacterium]HOM81206.1 sulfotransferase [Armatimonadota bacterium]HPO74506.1 sulfotransferase [Armatimonadota bacterium]
MMITVIGRGHSGTRAMSHTLSASGVYMGAKLNVSGDLIPAEELYEACRVMARYVEYKGGLEWDFSRLFTMPIDPAFTRLVESYLSSVLESDAERKGWKLPETTLILPWITRMFPDIYYIYWVRDPRDSIVGAHITDDLADFGVPYERTDDLRRRRAISWRYQYDIMQATPPPARRIHVRFEEFVLKQEETLRRLEDFLGFPMARIPVRPESVGRWRTDTETHDFDFFPREALYEG